MSSTRIFTWSAQEQRAARRRWRIAAGRTRRSGRRSRIACASCWRNARSRGTGRASHRRTARAGVIGPDAQRAKDLNKRRTTLEKALAGKTGVELLAPDAGAVARAVTEARATRSICAAISAIRRSNAMRELLRDTEATYANFEKLRGELERIYRNDRMPVEVGDDAARLARWQATRRRVQGHRRCRGMAAGCGHRFRQRCAPDHAGRWRRLRDDNPRQAGKDFTKELLAIDQHFRVLESGHDLADVIEGYASGGRGAWEIYNPKSRTANAARLGLARRARLRALPEELGRALQLRGAARSSCRRRRRFSRRRRRQPFTPDAQPGDGGALQRGARR